MISPDSNMRTWRTSRYRSLVGYVIPEIEGEIWPGGLDVVTSACLWYLKEHECLRQADSCRWSVNRRGVEGRALGEICIGGWGNKEVCRIVKEENTFKSLKYSTLKHSLSLLVFLNNHKQNFKFHLENFYYYSYKAPSFAPNVFEHIAFLVYTYFVVLNTACSLESWEERKQIINNGNTALDQRF